jgi:hypothetical protein
MASSAGGSREIGSFARARDYVADADGEEPAVGDELRERRHQAFPLCLVDRVAVETLACLAGTALSSSPVRLAGGWALPRHQRGVSNAELATAADDL